MADGLEVTMDAVEVVDALNTLGDFAQPYINDASQVSATAIETEAKARLRRQLSGLSTGETEAGVSSRPAYDGNGFIVLAENVRMRNLPLWIEKGIKRGRPRSHSHAPRPFFYVSAEIEQGAHFRRIGDALQDALDDRGLGQV